MMNTNSTSFRFAKTDTDRLVDSFNFRFGNIQIADEQCPKVQRRDSVN